MNVHTQQLQIDFLIIGSGAAGLLTASRLAPHGQVMLRSRVARIGESGMDEGQDWSHALSSETMKLVICRTP